MDHLFTVSGLKATPVTRTWLAAEGLRERQELQEWVIAHPEVLGESVLVVTSESDRWTDADGVPAKDRLDVLGLDATGRRLLDHVDGEWDPEVLQRPGWLSSRLTFPSR